MEEVQRRKMSNQTTFQRYVAPIVVLVGICLVISAALAATYGIANPIIERNTKAAQDAAMQALISDADTFSEYTGDLWTSEDGKASVTAVSTADNGAGMVVTVSTTSFGGKLTEMVGIDSTGALTGVQIINHADTPGVGTKAMKEEHLAQYVGLTELTSTAAKTEPAVNHVSGASVSSNGIHYGVYAALQQYAQMGGVQ